MNIYISIILWVTYFISLYFSIFLLLVFLERKFLPERPNRTTNQKFPRVSIIIPAYNEQDSIIDTLASVLALDYPKNRLEIVVINDGSTDRTHSIVSDYIKDKKNVTLLTHKNRGKAASLNRALGIISGEFFACLDADSVVQEDALSNMLELYYAQKNPDLAVIIPAMKVRSPATLLQKVQWIEYLVIALVSRLASSLDCLYVAPGPFSLYRTNIIQKLGGFDEETLTEDQEIAYRLQAHHYRIQQCPDAFVHTTAPENYRAFYSQRRRWYKGSLSCIYKYRNLILNRSYGDFGMIQMLKNTAGFLIALSGALFFVYFIILPSFSKLYDFWLIGFDVIPFFRNLTFSFQLLSFDISKLFILGILFFIGFVFFASAHKNGQEKFGKLSFLPAFPYFFIYYVAKGIIILAVITECALMRKQKWS